LLTSNIHTSFDFYSKLFGWEKMQAIDMGPQGTYQIFGTGGHQLGGVFNPGGFPPGGPLWVPYIQVRDARRTSESAKTLGATIALGPMEVPGGDWVFTGVDPQGAMFAAHSFAKRVTKNTHADKFTKKATKAAMKTTKATKKSAKASTTARAKNAKRDSRKKR
jgi:predicted enzyme related to lactoylglutathione lyase